MSFKSFFTDNSLLNSGHRVELQTWLSGVKVLVGVFQRAY